MVLIVAATKEVERHDGKQTTSRLRRAKFEGSKTFEGFDFGFDPKGRTSLGPQSSTFYHGTGPHSGVVWHLLCVDR